VPVVVVMAAMVMVSAARSLDADALRGLGRGGGSGDHDTLKEMEAALKRQLKTQFKKAEERSNAEHRKLKKVFDSGMSPEKQEHYRRERRAEEVRRGEKYAQELKRIEAKFRSHAEPSTELKSAVKTKQLKKIFEAKRKEMKRSKALLEMSESLKAMKAKKGSSKHAGETLHSLAKSRSKDARKTSGISLKKIKKEKLHWKQSMKLKKMRAESKRRLMKKVKKNDLNPEFFLKSSAKSSKKLKKSGNFLDESISLKLKGLGHKMLETEAKGAHSPKSKGGRSFFKEAKFSEEDDDHWEEEGEPLSPEDFKKSIGASEDVSSYLNVNTERSIDELLDLINSADISSNTIEPPQNNDLFYDEDMYTSSPGDEVILPRGEAEVTPEPSPESTLWPFSETTSRPGTENSRRPISESTPDSHRETTSAADGGSSSQSIEEVTTFRNPDISPTESLEDVETPTETPQGESGDVSIPFSMSTQTPVFPQPGVTKIPKEPSPLEPHAPRPWNLGTDQCGKARLGTSSRGLPPRVTKILQGKEALPGAFPWQVAILDADRVATLKKRPWKCGAKKQDLLCGGSLIAPRWVMTAAHCVRKRLFVRLREHHIREKDGREIQQKVRRIYRHPSYNASTIDNDIALLYLPPPPSYASATTGLVSPGVTERACLPADAEDMAPVGTRCMVMGWGKASTNHFFGTDVLMYTTLPVISRKACVRANRKTITENMFCAGHYKGGSDTCSGDSGGPLLCSPHAPPGQEVWTVYGITSFGDGCGNAGKMGVYAKVNNYLDWIDGIMSRYL